MELDPCPKKHLLEACLDYVKNLDADNTFTRDSMIRALNVGMDAVEEAELWGSTEKKKL